MDTTKLKEYAVFTWKLANIILFEDTPDLREAIRTLTKKQ